MDKSKAFRKRKESDGQHQAEKLLEIYSAVDIPFFDNQQKALVH
ncbi:hypothetical protein T11_9329 [Trichinella zimbabwensis]|uniref:Uncharacterized protein n=1 Tax=Trichinella zimbabwensis TaxID=268475 RepID=A0A0V1GHE4_9BILA|nr:hypothetical protein T11_9329 [Trichinella zimbabwensis]